MENSTTIRNRIVNDITYEGLSESDLLIIFAVVKNELNLKTITNYAKDNNMSYNGVKNHRKKIEVDGVSFVPSKKERSNLPF